MEDQSDDYLGSKGKGRKKKGSRDPRGFALHKENWSGINTPNLSRGKLTLPIVEEVEAMLLPPIECREENIGV